MKQQNILNNDAAMTILQDAARRLQAIGVHCTVSPMDLPQGMSVSLHVGATMAVSAAADVAAGCGGAFAHAAETHEHFQRMVADAIVDAEVDKAATQEYQAAMDRENP